MGGLAATDYKTMNETFTKVTCTIHINPKVLYSQSGCEKRIFFSASIMNVCLHERCSVSNKINWCNKISRNITEWRGWPLGVSFMSACVLSFLRSRPYHWICIKTAFIILKLRCISINVIIIYLIFKPIYFFFFIFNDFRWALCYDVSILL